VLTLSEPFCVPDSFSKECREEAPERTSDDPGANRVPQLFIRWLAAPLPDVSVDWCVDSLLTEPERHDYVNRFSNEDARLDWLLGRLTAKEAVRELVFVVWDNLIPSNEIEIRTADDGSPTVYFVGNSSVTNTGKPAGAFFVSITHSRKRAYALAFHTDGAERFGIDCELLREVEPGMTELVFEAEERTFIEQQPSDRERNLAFFRLWTAREALLKATSGSEKRPYVLLSSGEDQIIVNHKDRERKILTLNHEGYAVAIAFLARKDRL
jgi:Phosphopantetheinyl transferase